jgi:histidine triad (HIT) family protein
MASIFSKIVSGEIPCYKIAETEDYLAFLDVMPLKKGHVLVIPKQEIDYIFDMSQEQYSGLWIFAQKVSLAMKNVMPCKKIGVAVVGLEVPHAHIHLVPIDSVADMDFSKPKITIPATEMLEIAKLIEENYN